MSNVDRRRSVCFRARDCFTALLASASLAGTGAAGDHHEVRIVPLPNPGLNASLGNSTAISGNRALVGAFRYDAGDMPDTGIVYALEYGNGGWVYKGTIVPTDPQAGDHFGGHIAIDGEWAVIGAYGSDIRDTEGSVYFFRRVDEMWVQFGDRRRPSDGAPGNDFGGYVAIDGDYAVVGAAHAATGRGRPESGAAYVFHWDGTDWVETSKLMPDDQVRAGDVPRFGAAVGISGKTIVVGAPGDDGLGRNAGEAYVFVRDGAAWSLETKLADPAMVDAGDQFGISAAIDGERLVVGSLLDSVTIAQQGSASVFERSGSRWAFNGRLVAPSPGSSDYFGLRCAIDGEVIVVPAIWNDQGGTNSGAAYLYLRGTDGVWSCTATLRPKQSHEGDEFGVDVAVSGTKILLGGPLVDVPDHDSGLLYEFSMVAILNPACPLDINMDGNVDGGDLGLLLGGWGGCL